MLDAVHAGLLAALMQADTCAASDARRAVGQASLQRIGRLAHDEVVLASVQAPCTCGASGNCPYYVMRGKTVLLATSGLEIDRRPGSPLPQLTVVAHDSSLVMDQTTYRFDGTRYVTADAVVIRSSDGTRKPLSRPIRFAPGASSEAVHGIVSLGWDDEYTFSAHAGQRLTAAVPRGFDIALFFGDSLLSSPALEPGTPYRLRSTGTYMLLVQSQSEHDTRYAMTVTIR